MYSRLPKILLSDVPFPATKESLIQVLPEDGVEGPALPRSIVEPEPASLLTLPHVCRQCKSLRFRLYAFLGLLYCP